MILKNEVRSTKYYNNIYSQTKCWTSLHKPLKIDKGFFLKCTYSFRLNNDISIIINKKLYLMQNFHCYEQSLKSNFIFLFQEYRYRIID